MKAAVDRTQTRKIPDIKIEADATAATENVMREKKEGWSGSRLWDYVSEEWPE